MMGIRTVHALERTADVIDAFNTSLGRGLSWVMVPVVLVSFTVLFLRYVLSKGYPWMQELYVWMHGAAVLLCAAWVLKEGGHARMNLLYDKWSASAKAWADLIGLAIFLYPMMGFLFWWSLPAVQRSWRLMERSPTADGLQFAYLMKTVVPIFCVLVMIQALSSAIRCVLIIVRERRPNG